MTTKGKDSENCETTRESEREESFRMLSHCTVDGKRGTRFCRTSSFTDICENGSFSRNLELSEVSGVYLLFWNQPARGAHSQFRKFYFTADDQISVLSVILLQAFLKSTIDAFSEDELPTAPQEGDGSLNAGTGASLDHQPVLDNQHRHPMKGVTSPTNLFVGLSPLFHCLRHKFTCTSGYRKWPFSKLP